jgi:LysM repeat protein
MIRLSLITSLLLAFALTGVIVASLFFFGILPAPRVAGASPSPFPSGMTFPTPTPTTAAETAEPTPTLEPTPTAQPTAGGTYTVQPGDSLAAIGLLFGVPWELIAEANGIEPPNYVIQPGQVLVIPTIPQPSDGSQIYVVQPGDSIIGIAQDLGIDPTELADFNNLADWNSIQPGQILYIPEPGSTPLPLETPEE